MPNSDNLIARHQLNSITLEHCCQSVRYSFGTAESHYQQSSDKWGSLDCSSVGRLNSHIQQAPGGSGASLFERCYLCEVHTKCGYRVRRRVSPGPSTGKQHCFAWRAENAAARACSIHNSILPGSDASAKLWREVRTRSSKVRLRADRLKVFHDRGKGVNVRPNCIFKMEGRATPITSSNA